ncbi:toxin-antitoxin system, antitoxin component, HicB family [Tissierellia bacterium KA00581]|jgi:hypothetical protein|nr:toxin-antitoxin system, antitoxin component, HicB family [Tissierellia bacterium KA00581]
MKYNFFGIVEKSKSGYCVYFPDVLGCTSSGETIENAIKNAGEALSYHLMLMEDYKEDMPKASDFSKILKECENEDFVSLFFADTDFIRKKEKNKIVNKTVTLPEYLVDLGKMKKINFSKLLQQALKKELNV